VGQNNLILRLCGCHAKLPRDKWRKCLSNEIVNKYLYESLSGESGSITPGGSCASVGSIMFSN